VARRLARLGLLLFSDLLLLRVFSTLVHVGRVGPWLPPEYRQALDELLPYGALLTARFPVVVVLSLAALGAYGAVESRRANELRVVAAILTMMLPTWATLWQFTKPLVGTVYVTLTVVLALCLIAAQRLSEAARRILTPRRFRASNVLLLAAPQDLARAHRHRAVSDPRLFAIRGVFDPVELTDHDALESLCQAIRRADADTVMLCCGLLSDHAFNIVIDATYAMGCGLVSLTRSRGDTGVRPRLISPHGSPLMVLTSPASRTLQLLFKRIVDLLGAVVGLTLTAPVLALLAVLIRLESAGPILFGQRRVGAWGQPFRCLKFRTMRVDAEEALRRNPVLYAMYLENNYKLPEGEDPRITRVGRLLRKTSLDELPQLWNVLRGHMSLIGPRPVVPDELNEYGEKRRVFLSVKPGLSGAWAITGRSRVGYPDRAAIELGYIRRWRFGRDLSILWRTVPAVLTRRGAH
jgi:lipopolysaccharide/colanic/teichoic acid biosynthesis glycosyltransferase